MIMDEQEQKVTPFLVDVYLYDLNRPEMPPLAYRSARGGEEQPDLLSLIPLSACAWQEVAEHLYGGAVYLSQDGGAILLPVFGSLGRLALVVKTNLPLSALAYVYQCAGQGEVYADQALRECVPKLSAKTKPIAEDAVHTVAQLRRLTKACESVLGAYDAMECIDMAQGLMGVSCMSDQRVETAPLQGQEVLPLMQHAGQVLLACVLTLLSVMRNDAHARSGWLYALPCGQGYTLQVFLRLVQQETPEALVRLRTMFEMCDVAFCARVGEVPVIPPKQYSYMSRKITDPHKPLCARCGRLDARCAHCTAVQWSVLPYVCDTALLGIKTLPHFEFE